MSEEVCTIFWNNKVNTYEVPFCVAPPPDVDYVINYMGTWDSSGLSDVLAEGTLPAVSALYNLTTETVDTIYQRYRVTDGGFEVDGLQTLAIVGDYAISAGYLNNTGAQIAITPYNTDANIKLAAAWETDTTLVNGSTVALIDMPGDYELRGIMVLNASQFVTIGEIPGFISGATLHTFYIVTWTDEVTRSVTSIGVDIGSLGYNGGFDFHAYVPNAVPLLVADPTTSRLAVRFEVETSDFTPKSLVVLVDTTTGNIIDHELYDPTVWPMAIMLGPNDAVPEYFIMSQGNNNFNHVRLELSTQSGTNGLNFAGDTIEFATYTARTMNAAGRFVDYTDYSTDTSDLTGKLETKLTSLGYTVVDTLFFPALTQFTST